MAITILENIDPNYTYNKGFPVIVRCSSNNTAQNGFQFVCDVYRGNGTLIARLMKPPFVGLNSCLFDISKVLSDEIDVKFTSLASGRLEQNNQSFYCQLGEFYNDTFYLDLTITSDGTYYPCQNEYEEHISTITFSSPIYNTIGGTSKQFLTDQKTRRLPLSASSYLCGVNTNSDINQYAVQRWANGSTVGSPLVGTVVMNSPNVRGFALSVGPQDIINAFGSSILNGIDYYEVWVQTTGTRRSEKVIVQIDNRCTMYDTYLLHYFNKRGGYDTAVFNKLSRETDNITRSNYKINNYGFNGSSVELVRQTRPTYNVNIETSFNLNSDWMTESEAFIMRQLFSSPDVWLQLPTGANIPVIVTDNGYERKRHINDDLISYSVNVQKSINYKR